MSTDPLSREIKVDLSKVKIEVPDSGDYDKKEVLTINDIYIKRNIHGILVPNLYVNRRFKPIQAYITAPTITKRQRKKTLPTTPVSPSPHISADTEFRFYDGLGPYQGDLILEEDLARLSPRSWLPRFIKREHIDTESLQDRPQEPSPSPHPYPTEKNRLTILYSYPHHGSTSVFANLLEKISARDPTRWIRYINLKQASKILAKAPRSSWTLSKLIISYFKITEQSEIHKVQSFFFEYDRIREDDCRRVKIKKEKKEDSNILIADVFLDELDEMSPDTLETMLTILRKINWHQSCARVWVTARTHLKAKIDETVISWLVRGETWIDELLDCFEMLPISYEEQIAFLYKYWKMKNFQRKEKRGRNLGDITELEPEDYDPFWQRLKSFVTQLYHQLDGDIPQFYKTLGACPFHLIIVAEHFTPDLTRYFENEASNTSLKFLNISLTKFLEKFVQSKFDYFYENYIISIQPTAGNRFYAMHDEVQKETIFRKMSRLQVRLAINTHAERYVVDCRQVRHILTCNLEDEHDLYLMGFVQEVNGQTKFLHDILVDFLLAQYFVDYGRQKNTGVYYINFFLNNVLFHDQCQRVRKFFDDYMILQQQRKKMKENIMWQRLRLFLIQHYCLENDNGEQEQKPVDAEPKKRGKGKQKKLTVAVVVDEEDKGENEVGQEIELKAITDVRFQRGFDPMWTASILDDEEPLIWKLDEVEKSSEVAGPSSLNEHTNSPGEKVVVDYNYVKDKGSVLHLALIEGNMAIAHILIDSFKGYTDSLKKFVEISVPLKILQRHVSEKGQGMNVDMQVSILHTLALFGRGEEITEKMLCQILSVMDSSQIQLIFGENSWTPLHFAAMNSNWEFLQAIFAATLVQRNDKIDPNMLNPNGASPLHMVLISNSWFYLMEIMDHPHPGTCAAEVEEEVDDFKPPRRKRRKSNPRKNSTNVTVPGKITVEDASKLSQKFIKYNGIVKRFYKIQSYDDDEMNNPCNRHIMTLEILLKNGADINASYMWDDVTILHQASALESPIIFDYLVEKGANKESKDRQGRTASDYQKLVPSPSMRIPGLLNFPPKDSGIIGLGICSSFNNNISGCDESQSDLELSQLFLEI